MTKAPDFKNNRIIDPQQMQDTPLLFKPGYKKPDFSNLGSNISFNPWGKNYHKNVKFNQDLNSNLGIYNNYGYVNKSNFDQDDDSYELPLDNAETNNNYEEQDDSLEDSYSQKNEYVEKNDEIEEDAAEGLEEPLEQSYAESYEKY